MTLQGVTPIRAQLLAGTALSGPRRRRLFLDIETRSACDLKLCGQYVYAEDPTTEITTFGYVIDDGPVKLWLPILGEPIPGDLFDALVDPDVQLVAHNASFERTLLSGPAGRRLLGALAACLADVERWDCTAARAAACGLPRTLEGAAAAAGLDVTKDKEGHALMLRMCKPRPKVGGYIEDAASVARLGAYCVRDVEVERALDKIVPHLRPDEVEAWRMTERTNDRGIRVDGDLLVRMALLIDDATRDINRRISAETRGAVPKVSDHGALTRWLLAQDIDDSGLGADGVGKHALEAMLENADLDPFVRSVLMLRKNGGGSSSTKYAAIMRRLSADGRLRGALVYCGAASTGRWASRGAQLHNLPRGGSVKRPLNAIRDVFDGASLAELEEIHGPPLIIASELLRPVFVAPPGHWLVRGDYSQIEARVLPWLAGAEWKLQMFRDFDAGTGAGLYELGAAGIYGVTPAEITAKDPRRQVGKVSELALGFQGGPGALQAMARAYAVKIPRFAGEDRRNAPNGTDQWIVNRWRAANPEVSDYESGFWAKMERASLACMQAPCGVFHPVEGAKGTGFIRNAKAMAMRLPAGGSILYWTPRLSMRRMPWGADKLTIVCRGEDSQSRQWWEYALYGGILTENAVQRVARDIMRGALLRMEAAEIWPVLTVHDEGVGEAPMSRYPTAADATAAIETIIRQQEPWAAGLPIAADASAAARYVKG